MAGCLWAIIHWVLAPWSLLPSLAAPSEPPAPIAPTISALSPPSALDADRDGHADEPERQDGADPGNPASVQPLRLGYWRFNAPALEGEQGQIPLARTNLNLIPSFEGQGIEPAPGADRAALIYRCRETDGHLNLALRNGSVRFWFKNTWTSFQSPARWMRLVDTGVWTLSLSPRSERLVFQSRDASGRSVTNLQVNISIGFALSERDRAQNWHEVVLRYTPTNSSLIVDGDIKKDLLTQSVFGAGLSPGHPAEVEGSRFAVGSGLDGTRPIAGALDELETFNYMIEPARNDSFRGRTVLAAAAASSPPSLELRWFFSPSPFRSLAGDGDPLWRRGVDPGSWLSTNAWESLGVMSNRLSFQDTRVVAGQPYEYRLGSPVFANERYLFSGIDLPPVEDRGQVLLLVAENVVAALASSLRQLEADLAGDGWTVVRRSAPVHDDQRWPVNAQNVVKIKAQILADYQHSANTLRAVLLVGHVTVPYSGGQDCEDGHFEHLGAWPADAYYGDVDGLYTDEGTYAPSAPEPWRNLPGDGKFDQQTFPANRRGERGLELAVGRIDFARLPALGQTAETELLRRYLDKDHRFRHGLTTLPGRVVVGTYFGEPYHPYGLGTHQNALRAAGALWGVEPERLELGDIFQPAQGALIGLQSGYGGHDAINNNRGFNPVMGCDRFATADFALPSREPRVGWYVLSGSWFGDWNLADNFMRGALSTPNYGLLASWGFHVNWRWDALGLNEPVGKALVWTSRGLPGVHLHDPVGYHSLRVLALLGDPTLRLLVTAPVSDLETQTHGADVRLTWRASPAPKARYLVYRSLKGLAGPFLRLTPEAITSLEYPDLSAPTGPKLYQVRTLEPMVTASGSFANLSQGIFAEAR